MKNSDQRAQLLTEAKNATNKGLDAVTQLLTRNDLSTLDANGKKELVDALDVHRKSIHLTPDGIDEALKKAGLAEGLFTLAEESPESAMKLMLSRLGQNTFCNYSKLLIQLADKHCHDEKYLHILINGINVDGMLSLNDIYKLAENGGSSAYVESLVNSNNILTMLRLFSHGTKNLSLTEINFLADYYLSYYQFIPTATADLILKAKSSSITDLAMRTDAGKAIKIIIYGLQQNFPFSAVELIKFVNEHVYDATYRDVLLGKARAPVEGFLTFLPSLTAIMNMAKRQNNSNEVISIIKSNPTLYGIYKIENPGTESDRLLADAQQDAEKLLELLERGNLIEVFNSGKTKQLVDVVLLYYEKYQNNYNDDAFIQYVDEKLKASGRSMYELALNHVDAGVALRIIAYRTKYNHPFTALELIRLAEKHCRDANYRDVLLGKVQVEGLYVPSIREIVQLAVSQGNIDKVMEIIEPKVEVDLEVKVAERSSILLEIYRMASLAANNSSSDDPYVVLDLKRDCSSEDIGKAYRKLALQYHPDKGPGNADKFKAVREAYGRIGNAKDRAQWDREHPAGPAFKK